MFASGGEKWVSPASGLLMGPIDDPAADSPGWWWNGNRRRRRKSRADRRDRKNERTIFERSLL